ncbi:Mcm2-7 hexameric complex component [Phytophthora boehmeriae]|uniref:DNA helicase n=1 Tax=Phytophthora boehmeriae TaxID=109152 RepID=A0A8T1W235_9STRA|nr:Mcm2-7 hexameric complex component [Phytophthora boehmeriae]
MSSSQFSQTFGGVGGGDGAAADASGGSGGAGMSNYAEEKAKCAAFLLNFTSNLDDPALGPKYMRMLQEVANRERTSIPISLDDVQIFEHDEVFVTRIVRNARRYIALFSDAVDENLPPPTRDISDSQDVLDVLRMSRAQEMAQQRQAEDPSNQSEGQTLNAANIFPPALMRRFEVHLIPGVKLKAVPIREVKAAKVGALMQMGLVTETYLEATDVVNHKKRYSAMESSEAMESAVLRLQEGSANVYEVLSQSLAPEIYGHEDVKKALLLLLIGGVTKRMDEGMKLRGDLNVLLMGDPGVAKSQLLKHIATVAPRGVYTTGKGSSGVGLTAAVVRDTTTKEMTLEGGALVLADMGICCIDEFDKMEEGDRTAIHEVMEQQTVSIAKAGITTTLNARTSVLAAANPIFGRYNKKLSASQNINLPNALLSRFDLLFLLLDVANYEKDEALARHVTYVHRFSRNPDMKFEPVRPEVLRYFIAIAKQYQPNIPEHLCGYIVEAYVTLRQQDANEHARERKQQQFRQQYGDGGANDAQTAMTARQLLSILRLSQALARLRFSTEVIHQDVDEAIRLVYVSKASLTEQDETNGGGNSGKTGTANGGRSGSTDATSRIYRLLLEFATDRGLKVLPMSDLEPVVLRKGFTTQQLHACIEFYQELEVMQLAANGTRVTII